MKTFVIETTNFVKVFASSERAPHCRDGTRFATEKDFASASRDWSMHRLVEIWNKLPGAKPVRKFTNRDTALRRLWATIQVLSPETKTKADLVMGMISRPSGATLAEITAATGWQAHTVRGFISVQPKKLGFKIESLKREGERVYRIGRGAQ